MKRSYSPLAGLVGVFPILATAYRRVFGGEGRKAWMFPVAIALTFSPTAGLCMPSQGSITVTPAAPTPGVPVTVAWTLINTTNTLVAGPVVYYLNANPLTAISPSGTTTLKPGAKTSGTFTFLPVPGWNQVSVGLTNKLVPNPTTVKKPPILQELAPGQLPKPTPRTPTAAPMEPASEIFPATVTTSFSVTTSVLPSTGLTADNRKQILKQYAPLILYSYDHNSDEQYAPIDVLPFVEGSSLQSQVTGIAGIPNTTLAASPRIILNPLNSNTSPAGTITSSAAPVGLYLIPSDATQHGADWKTVMARQDPNGPNVGLYGRAILLDLSSLSPNDPAVPAAGLRGHYNCASTGACSAQVVKIEYWQFFGFSHDYYGGGPAIEADTDHMGDWCTVQLYVDASWWQSSRPDRAILYVFHYLHGHQVGFDLGQANTATMNAVVPVRPASDTRPTYPAQQYQGPNSGNSVELSVKVAGSWEPVGGPNMTEELSEAQNNTLQLAGVPSVAPAPPKGEISIGLRSLLTPAAYTHPVVYAEWGGHEFWPTPSWTIYGASNHNGMGQYSYFGTAPVDVTVAPQYDTAGGVTLPTPPTQDDVALVTLFSGYWGAPQNDNGPPQGPPLHCEWFWDPTTYGPLLNALQSGQSTDPAALQNGQLSGTCGGGRPF
jgi:hypothetical protein